MSNTPVDQAEPIERWWPETYATDELRLEWEFLTFLRITAVNKIAGLTPEQAAARPLSTSPLSSLTGVIKHLTAIERFWISIIGGGADSPAAAVAAYRAEWELSGQAIAGMSGDDKTRGHDGRKETIRWILTHLMQEAARQVGHMDVLRELADGERGE